MPKGKNRKVIILTKDKLGGKIMTKSVRLRTKTYNYLIDDGREDKKKHRTNKSLSKKENLHLKIMKTN